MGTESEKTRLVDFIWGRTLSMQRRFAIQPVPRSEKAARVAALIDKGEFGCKADTIRSMFSEVLGEEIAKNNSREKTIKIEDLDAFCCINFNDEKEYQILLNHSPCGYWKNAVVRAHQNTPLKRTDHMEIDAEQLGCVNRSDIASIVNNKLAFECLYGIIGLFLADKQEA